MGHTHRGFLLYPGTIDNLGCPTNMSLLRLIGANTNEKEGNL